MNISTKLLKAAAGQAGGAGLDVDEVFSTFLYDGTGSTQTITNNIDLSGEGGLVWTKSRSAARNHSLHDSARGVTCLLKSNATNAQYCDATQMASFNSNGFTVGSDGSSNTNGDEYVSWTFRKAPKFFDVISIDVPDPEPTSVTVNHNLGQEVGMVIMKPYLHTYPWYVWHRSIGANYSLELNSTAARSYVGGSGFSSTSTTITIPGSFVHSGSNNGKCILYLFAHNNSDGGFGPDSDQDVIKCGSFTVDSSYAATVNLGFEPQFLMVKRYDGTSKWETVNVNQGWDLNGANTLFWNNTNAESDIWGGGVVPTSTGFEVTTGLNIGNYIYMAIRRGPLAAPTDATKVFAIDGETDTSPTPPTFNSGFPVDFWMGRRNTAGVDTWYLYDRLRKDDVAVSSNLSDAEFTAGGSYSKNDRNDGIGDFATVYYANSYAWMWKRAPSYFDVVAYTGTGSAMTVNHNLSAIPEMIWVKARNATQKWAVYHSAMGNTHYMRLNDTTDQIASSTRWNDTSPTASVFTVGTDSQVNNSSYDYIAYLFATVAGVSKVGSYTGNDTGQNIDCGFSNGARFVLIKCSSHGDRSWMVFDSTRGIVAGADPFLTLNSNSAEYYAYNGAGSEQNYTSSNLDLIDPYSSGFAVVGGTGMVNENGKTYIFYAIA